MHHGRGRRRIQPRYRQPSWLLSRVAGGALGVAVLVTPTSSASAADEPAVEAAEVSPERIAALVAAYEAAIAADPQDARALTDLFLSGIIPGRETRADRALAEAAEDAERDRERAEKDAIREQERLAEEAQWAQHVATLIAAANALTADAGAASLDAGALEVRPLDIATTAPAWAPAPEVPGSDLPAFAGADAGASADALAAALADAGEEPVHVRRERPSEVDAALAQAQATSSSADPVAGVELPPEE